MADITTLVTMILVIQAASVALIMSLIVWAGKSLIRCWWEEKTIHHFRTLPGAGSETTNPFK